MKRLALACALFAACRAAEPAGDVTTVTVRPAADAAPIVSDPAPDAGEHACVIDLGEVVSAHVYRGVRGSQSRRDVIDKLDPQTRMKWESMDHGVSYLLCKYGLRMNGRAYTYEHVAGQSFSQSKRLEERTCDLPETRSTALDRIRSATHDCTDPHAGAYWGFDLVPTD